MKKRLLFPFFYFGFFYLSAQQTSTAERIELRAEVRRNEPVHTEVISMESEAVGAMEEAFQNYDKAVTRSLYRASSSNGTYQGIIEGKASVSLSGGLTYEVPIAVPPGVKGAVPNLSLSYNGQGGIGAAGYGWNISGLSTIARIPSDLYHNGFIAGVNLSDQDALALDSQRLIPVTGKSQQYQTENFSNIKVLKYYGDFRVYYPEGSSAEYDNFDRWPALEYPIKSWRDKQGNEIRYDYEFSDRTARISKIKYGGSKGKELFNEVRFIYKTRSKPVISYIGGYSFKRTHVLSEIQVYAHGRLLRKYRLEHSRTEAGQERVSSITEYNGEGQAKPPIRFYYKRSENTVSTRDFKALYGPYGDWENVRFLSGDFDGDGFLDFMGYNEAEKDQLSIYTRGGQGQTKLPLRDLSNFKAIFPSKTLDSRGRLSLNDGVTLVKESIKDDHSNYSQVKFYSSQRAAPSTGQSIGFLRSKTVDFPSVVYEEGDEYCAGGKREVTEDPRKSIQKYVVKTKIMPKEFVSGDFNGDGITDILAIEEGHYHRQRWLKRKSSSYWYPRPFSEPFHPYVIGFEDCSDETSYTSGGSVYWADLNAKNTSASAERVGSISSFDKYKMTLQTGDYNGDGKTDLFVIRDGKVAVYGLNKENRLEKIAEKSDSWIDKDKYIALADFNGDGKTDLVAPEKEGSSRWKLFISDGDDYFITKIISITSYQKQDRNYVYRYLVSDFNRDGKSDLLKVSIPAYVQTRYLGTALDLYTFNGLESSTAFTHKKTIKLNNIYINTPILGGDINLNTRNPEVGFYTTTKAYGSTVGQIKSVSFNQNFREDTTLDYIYNAGNGKKLQIDYHKEGRDLFFPFDQAYMKAYDNRTYPYINISSMLDFRLVRKLGEEVNGKAYRWKEFKYYGGVSHAQGLGFLGFRGRAQSSWHDGSTRALWTVSLHKPELRSAVTYTYVTDYSPYFGRYNSDKEDNIPEDVISKTHYEYTTKEPTTGTPGVFINFPKKVTSTDKLAGVTTTQTFAYDSYWNPSSVVTDYNGAGTSENRYEYLNNSSATSGYYMARVSKEKSISRAYGDTFESSTEYRYDAKGNATQIVKKGNGSEESLTEQLTYDSFGNITQRSLSGTGAEARVESFAYDATGRFVTEKTEVGGQVTGYENDPDTGLLLSETDPLGRRTTYSYDGWNRPLTVKDYLEHKKRFEYAYNPESSGGFVVKESNPEAENKQTYYDAHGRAYKTKALSLNGQWIAKEVKYDALDRKYAQSEPYISGGANQWTRTEYDEYGRIKKVTAPTGRTMTTSYSGLSVSVDDGVQTKTTEKDALGNVVRQTDAGGTISYTYYANGNQKKTNYAGNEIQIEQDAWGRKTKLTDPSAGEYRYEYNIFGQVLKEIHPKGETEMAYDAAGRMIHKTLKEGDQTYTTDYTYDKTTQLLTRSQSQTDDENSMSYRYDEYGRPIEVIEDNTRASYTNRIAYDEYGRKASENRSTQVKGKNIAFENTWAYEYERGSGLLRRITDNQGHALYEVKSLNARGQLLQADLGNGIKVENTYDAYGYLTKQREASLNETAMDYEYAFDKLRGNLLSRKNYALTNHYAESFSYDTLDRLTRIQNTETTSSMGYDKQGRIVSNSEIGSYHYQGSEGASMFQMQEIELNEKGNERFAGRERQEAVFTAFKKPREISESGSGEVSFEYNGGLTRSFAEIRGAERKEEQEMQEVAYRIRTEGMSYDKGTGTITKTAASGWGNAGFSSNEVLHGDFEVSWRLANSLSMIIGVSNYDSNAAWQGIYEGIFFDPYVRGGRRTLKINGRGRRIYGSNVSFADGDRVSIKREGEEISYYHNGTRFYTSTIRNGGDMVIDASCFSKGASISDLKIKAVPINRRWKEVSYHLTDKTGISYDEGTKAITSTAGDGWGNSSFSTDARLSGDFKISWKAGQNDHWVMVGVSTRKRSAHHSTINWALAVPPSGHLEARMNGVRERYNFWHYEVGDTLSIARHGDKISYYQNGFKIYTSPRRTSSDLVVDAAFRDRNTSVSDLKIYRSVVPDHRIKLYNADQNTEVIEEVSTGKVKIIQYLGSPYQARIAYIGEYDGAGEVVSQGLYYLHRDYLGSIVGISDREGKVVEKRHYGAWGALEKYESSDSSLTQDHPLLDRGWTGHEYFSVVHLVHMNGRMYDTDLRRFLSPDNYVQDPSNTQNYNRYQYGYNNPLKYSDPSGEFFGLSILLSGLIIGALVGGASYAVKAAVTGHWKWGEFLGSIAIGAVSGLIGGAAYKAMEGIVSVGGFLGGAIKGAVSGFVGGFIGGAGNAVMNKKNIVKGAFSGALTGAAVGGLLGGVGEGLRAMKHGGNFWNGRGETYYLEADASTVNSTNKTEVEYSNKSAKEFSDKHLPGVREKYVHELHADGSLPPDTKSYGFMYEGEKGIYRRIENFVSSTKDAISGDIYGMTTRVKGGWDVFLGKAVFANKNTLFIAMQHEYIHAGFTSLGLFNKAFQHKVIYNFQRGELNAWGLAGKNVIPAIRNQILNNSGGIYFNSVYDMSKLAIPFRITPLN